MTDDNVGAVRRLVDEVINGGRLEVIDELLAPDFVEHQRFPGLEPNRAGVKKFFAMWRDAFPDTRVESEILVADGDTVALYGTWTGTHEGEFLGVPGTGRSFSVPTADFIRFRDGLGVEHWGVLESGLFMQQLGIVPSMAAVGA